MEFLYVLKLLKINLLHNNLQICFAKIRKRFEFRLNVIEQNMVYMESDLMNKLDMNELKGVLRSEEAAKRLGCLEENRREEIKD